MKVPWRIELLGRLCIKHGAWETAWLQPRKTGALLAYLAYYAARTHPREELLEILWPNEAPDVVRNRLRVALSTLRQQLQPSPLPAAPLLLADRAALQINAAYCSTDVAEFERALQAADHTPVEAEQAALLESAVALYGGDLLPGYEEAWVFTERQRLADAYLGALRRLTRQRAQAHDFDRALDYARRALNVDPLREESHRSLIRLYLAVGRPAAAWRQYQELAHLLREELGTTPTQATDQLVESLPQSVGSLPVPSSASSSPVSSRTSAVVKCAPSPLPMSPPSLPEPTALPQRNRLPVAYSRFFGREEESAQLRERLLFSLSAEARPLQPPVRLITLAGPGGSGKTRLALEVAGQVYTAYHAAVWWVPLADLSDPGLIPDAILNALGAERAPERAPLEQVGEILARQPSLLVLDNFEHLLPRNSPGLQDHSVESPDGAEILRQLCERIPLLTCLVTSRQPLALVSEQVFPVLPLMTPLKPGTPERLLEFPSVQLFVDRAQAVYPAFRVTEQNASDIAALCHSLEGVPLAIELAAAWAQMLTPAQMRSRLHQRFELLVNRRKDVPVRHRSLHAAMEWSARLLEPSLHRFFVRLSVFRGGWTAEAAEAFCLNRAEGEGPRTEPRPSLSGLDLLLQLRDRSLVVAEEVGKEMRFRLLEMLREYAAEQLDAGEQAELSRLHADYYLHVAEEAHTHIRSGQEIAVWLDCLGAEHDNLRTALDW
ncbi:MAG TPA: BTAD domain-containing putative transcriptional regulator, partial [Chthonomonadaceae bacterium]|nr:BTAD domain-containing putative transcriptional regulator [Chthonomonadaceae bacterium]